MGRRAGVRNGCGKAAIGRAKQVARSMVSVGLWAHLNNLVEAIKAGDARLLGEFQQMVQYAPPEMKEQLLQKLE